MKRGVGALPCSALAFNSSGGGGGVSFLSILLLLLPLSSMRILAIPQPLHAMLRAASQKKILVMKSKLPSHSSLIIAAAMRVQLLKVSREALGLFVYFPLFLV